MALELADRLVAGGTTEVTLTFANGDKGDSSTPRSLAPETRAERYLPGRRRRPLTKGEVALARSIFGIEIEYVGKCASSAAVWFPFHQRANM